MRTIWQLTTHARKLSLLGLLLSLLLGRAGLSAQSGGLNTLISYHELAEGGDAALLNVFFNVTDSGGLVVAGARVNEVSLQLNDESYAGRVTQAQGSSSIVLVLDASGSMAGANADMRRAAISAVEKARDKAQFAVISFSDQVQLVQDFSPQAADAINRVASIREGGTCLYDAAYAAVEKAASAPPGRRAVILFTDGVDEKVNGVPCSTRTLNEVLALARSGARRVPIYTVGLRGSSASGTGQINEGELASLASSTGGLSAIGGQSDLGRLFERIIEALTNQWQAQFALYPTAGTYTALLLPKVDSVSINPAQFQLSIAQDYLKPFQMQIDGFTYDQPSDTYTVTLSSVGAGRASSLRLAIVNKDSNTDQAARDFTGVPSTIRFTGREANLQANTSYTLRLRAIGPNDQPLGEALSYDFKHAPLPGEASIPPQVRLLQVIPNLAEGKIQVDVNAINPQMISLMSVIITDEGGATIRSERFEGLQTLSSFTLDIGDLERGRTYNVRVLAFDRSNLALPETQALKFRYGEPEPTPIISIRSIVHQPGERGVRLEIFSANAQRVSRMLLEVSAETNTIITDKPFFVQGTPPQYELPDEMLAQMKAGKYRVRLTPQDANGQMIGEAAVFEFNYVPPVPSFAETLAGIVTHPLVLSLLLAALILLGVYVWRSRQAQPSLGVLLDPGKEASSSRSTGRGGKDSSRARKLDTGELRRRDTKTQVDLTMAGGGRAPKTPVRGAVNHTTIDRRAPEETLPPQFTAYLKVVGPQHDPRYEDEERITIQKFIVGREGKGHMNFNYPSISRQHFSIEYQPDTKTFILTDSSANGTVVDGQRIKGEQITLPPNRPVTIIIGEDHERVTLQFSPTRSAKRGGSRSSDPLDS